MQFNWRSACCGELWGFVGGRQANERLRLSLGGHPICRRKGVRLLIAIIRRELDDA